MEIKIVVQMNNEKEVAKPNLAVKTKLLVPAISIVTDHNDNMNDHEMKDNEEQSHFVFNQISLQLVNNKQENVNELAFNYRLKFMDSIHCNMKRAKIKVQVVKSISVANISCTVLWKKVNVVKALQALKSN